MHKDEIGKFFDELRNNKKVQDKILAENPETLEDFAKVSGGVASTLGYKFSDEEILAYYNDRIGFFGSASDAAAASIGEVEDSNPDNGGPGCGALQVLLEKKLK